MGEAKLDKIWSETEFFNARCKECKKRDRLDPVENECMLDKVENGRLQNGVGRQSSNGSAGNGHIIGSDGDSISMSKFQEVQEISNGKPVVKRNTSNVQSDTNVNEHDGRQNSYHLDSASEQASGLTMNTCINGSEAASICENKIETRDRSKMSNSDSTFCNTLYNTLNADSLSQDDNSIGDQASESVFVHNSPQTHSSVPCDLEPDTIPKTMSDNFSIESVKELRKESLLKNNSNGNIPEALFQSLQTVPNRQTNLNEINQQSEVPELPAANPTAAREILKPQTRVKPMAKVIPVRLTSQEQQANAQSPGNGAEGYTPSPTTEYGNDIQQAVNNENHKVVANAPYGEYPDMSENNTEDGSISAQGPPLSMDGSGDLRQQPTLSTNHESPPTDEMNLHQTASGNVLATPSSDNSVESERNQSSLQQETVNQVPDTYSYP
ncbi:uncharacterized protein LOC134692497 [Mytilus trossulus]|uniref:uncharacterized protein LOC134692497 n=1 Tax=Mytilus trossulus TaxID=6551 RepID=UPI003004C29A